jgi:transketolase
MSNAKNQQAIKGSQFLAHLIRRDLLEMVERTKASHVASGLSIADIVAVLYWEVLNVRPNEPKWQDRDRFILSKGHAVAIVYAALARLGYYPVEQLQYYSRNGSNFMPHASHKVPGIEFSTGSLGHGLPFGVGKALACKKQRKSWRVFVQLSDGEMDEGSNWEALMFAAHHRLDNLIGIVDYNKLQSLDSVEKTIRLEPLADKFRAFGWSVREIDGHDHKQLKFNLQEVPWESGKPSMLIAHTTKGKGVKYMENQVAWHYKSPTKAELDLAIEMLRRDNA